MASSKGGTCHAGKEQSMACRSWGVQQSQTALIQGFEQALSNEPARLGLKQEMFLQSDKITSDPEKLPLFPSAEMPGREAGHLMNYETLGNERLCRQVLNISFPLAWLPPARARWVGRGPRKEHVIPRLTQMHLPNNSHSCRQAGPRSASGVGECRSM